MASPTFTAKFPAKLNEAIKLRTKKLNYRSTAAYLKGLARYDMMVQGDHPVSLPISHLPDEEQEAIDTELLILTKKGIGTRGQLLAHMLAEVVKLGKDVTAEAIVDFIRKACGSKRATVPK